MASKLGLFCVQPHPSSVLFTWFSEGPRPAITRGLRLINVGLRKEVVIDRGSPCAPCSKEELASDNCPSAF